MSTNNYKEIRAIKLIGYSFVHKRAVGIAQQHELKEDDWYAMRIKEIPGTILSNNSNANGSFYVVHAGDNNDKRVGSVEASLPTAS